MRLIQSVLISSSLLAMSASAAIAADLPEFRFLPSSSASTENTVILLGPDDSLDLSALAMKPGMAETIDAALTLNEFSGEYGSSVTFKGLAPYKNLTIMGTGVDSLSKRKLIDLGGHIADKVGSGEATILINAVDSEQAGSSAYIAKGYALKKYSFDKYQNKTTDDQSDGVDDVPGIISFIDNGADAAEALYQSDLKYVVEGTYLARDLGTEPGNRLYPQAFVEQVTPMFRNVPNVKIKILDARDIRDNNMGALWGSGRGSVHDPRLLVISYNGDSSGQAPLALVGKGITFDTGGISIKPNTNMWYMKSDLSGAAAVAGTVYAAASRGESINLVGVMPLSENMPSQDAIRPGDVLETRFIQIVVAKFISRHRDQYQLQTGFP